MYHSGEKMKARRFLKILIITLCVCLAAGTGIFIYNAQHNYNISNSFAPLPLKFNPDNSSSSFSWKGADITVYNGFVKGIQKGGDGNESLVIRALSPLPVVDLKAQKTPTGSLDVIIENISPEFYAKSLKTNFKPVRIEVNALKFTVNLNAGEGKRIEAAEPGHTENRNYVVLGDNRDGYETFGQIIDQVNAFKPVFVIDNGDLVFTGKPNQYRLFDRTISGLSATLCTTLGNHDIRGSGRETYTKLYGPNYYSFDFGNNHFVFLDSSPGWSQKKAISDEQYAWLERDLKKAMGKQIYVITHVPPEDPRSGTKPNEINYYVDKVEQKNGFFERKLENYSESESMDHGFQDKKEAQKFEGIMTRYKVNTVYLSHIHSYFDYTKNGVRYIISGGAGAELLTRNSYYHYLIVRADTRNSVTMVQLPSPANLLIKRYAATASLFAKAMYRENTAAVIFFIIGFVLLAVLLLLLISIKFNHRLSLLWILIKDTAKYIAKRYRELYRRKG
jgi:hypothetical protein